jgi:hypothetical protein
MKANADEILEQLTFEVIKWNYGASSAETAAERSKAKQQLADGLVAGLPRLNEKDYFDDSSPEWYEGYEAHLKATEAAIREYFR